MAEGPPEMREEEVEACAFGTWFQGFRSLTFKTEVVPLPESFVQFLLADGIHLVPRRQDDAASDSSGGCDEPDGADSESENESTGQPGRKQEEASFPELEIQVAAAIQRLGGAVLPKLNWSAPKDAGWLHGSLKCSTTHEVFTLLKASDYIAHDLCHSFDHCSTSRKRPNQFTLVLRRWHELYESNEFRCFVSEGALLAISQRQTSGFFEHLVEEEEQAALRRHIESFFEDHIRAKFALKRYAFDVYVASPPRRKMRLIDFSPWGPTTDACLFDWPELTEFADRAVQASTTAAAAGPARPEFRVVRDETDTRGKAERYSQMPLELAQFGVGEGLEELLKKADALLLEKGHG